MTVCTPSFRELSRLLSNVHCDSHSPVVTFTSPLSLQHWSMPVVEFLTYVGALALLWHGARRLRHYGDGSNLVVWFAALVTPLLIEGVMYFPQWFGIEDSVGLAFVHNQFTVQLLYDRMPLYLVAAYCFAMSIGYAVVQRAGIFSRYPVLVGAACTAFVTNAVFSPLDQVAPQLLWWVWNNDVPSGSPTVGVVPVMSLQTFDVAMPFAFALLARLLYRRPDFRQRIVARNVGIVALLTWPTMFVVMAPAMVVAALGASTAVARLTTVWAQVIGITALAVWAFLGARRARQADADVVDLDAGVLKEQVPFRCGVGALMLAVVFWSVALPDYLAAINGRIASGAPVSSFPYAVFCFCSAVFALYTTYRPTGAAVDLRAHERAGLR